MPSLDELRPLCIVAQHAPQLLNARRQRIVGHGDVWPHRRKEIVFRYRRTGIGHEDLQHPRGLGGEADLVLPEPQLAGVEMEAVLAEADALRHGSEYISGPDGPGLRR
jgi:hypothetical protein